MDDNSDGKAERIVTILSGLVQPNGVAWRNGALYVAEVSRVTRYDNADWYVLNNQVRRSPQAFGPKTRRPCKIHMNDVQAIPDSLHGSHPHLPCFRRYPIPCRYTSLPKQRMMSIILHLNVRIPKARAHEETSNAQTLLVVQRLEVLKRLLK